MEQADDGAIGLVPGVDGLRRGQELDLAAFVLEVGGGLFGQLDQAGLAGADDEALGTLVVDVLGFGQGDGVRGAIDL